MKRTLPLLLLAILFGCSTGEAQAPLGKRPTPAAATDVVAGDAAGPKASSRLPGKLEDGDRLRLQVLQLQAEKAELALQFARQTLQTAMKELATKYRLEEGDSCNSQTGDIVRKGPK